MKNKLFKILFIFCAVLLTATLLLTGCGQQENTNPITRNNTATQTQQTASSTDALATELAVSFGDGAESFTLYLEDNDTAKAIARYVGTADWRLPIYHYDDFENWEVMQYYDIPSRYDIPANPETITSAKGGEVYYSAPNRIVLFYHDAAVSGEYTKVGHFEYTEAFVSAVENNPVLEGWGNKIIRISTN